MKLSKRGEYALRALIDLALARAAGRELLQLNEICARENIPKGFLEQIFLQLREAGYIQSKRGKYGGYYLAHSPSDISMGAIVRLMDGPLAPIGCVSQTCYEKCSCPDEANCGLRILMLDVRNAIANILDKYTLEHVVNVTVKRLKQKNKILPFSDSFNTELSPSGKIVAEFIPFSDFEI